jgi:hypothetical protein
MITKVADFVDFCKTADNETIYDAFEFECSDDVRDAIYDLADLDSVEPLRNAMHKLGFVSF